MYTAPPPRTDVLRRAPTLPPAAARLPLSGGVHTGGAAPVQGQTGRFRGNSACFAGEVFAKEPGRAGRRREAGAKPMTETDGPRSAWLADDFLRQVDESLGQTLERVAAHERELAAAGESDPGAPGGWEE